MTSLLLAALMVAPTAQAAVSSAVASKPRSFAQAPSAPAGNDEDDEEDDAPASSTPPTPNPEPASSSPRSPGSPASSTKVEAPDESSGTNTTTAEQQRLVNGAPLYNPNVAVHIVEKKQFSDRHRHEIVLFPAAVQVNGKFTQHIGTAASYVFHLHENFAFQFSPVVNWATRSSAFNQELIEKVGRSAETASTLLLVWGGYAGVEVTPLYGKFAIYDGTLAHFSFVLSGGAGIGSTKLQLKEANVAGPATFGSTGVKFLGEVGGGFRLQIGHRFTLRFEVRDLVYTARVDQVNGCNGADLTALRGNPNAAVSGGCRADAFNSETAATDITAAYQQVLSPSSDVLNNVGFYAGLGIIF